MEASRHEQESTSPERAGLVLVALIAVAGLAVLLPKLFRRRGDGGA